MRSVSIHVKRCKIWSVGVECEYGLWRKSNHTLQVDNVDCFGVGSHRVDGTPQDQKQHLHTQQHCSCNSNLFGCESVFASLQQYCSCNSKLYCGVMWYDLRCVFCGVCCGATYVGCVVCVVWWCISWTRDKCHQWRQISPLHNVSRPLPVNEHTCLEANRELCLLKFFCDNKVYTRCNCHVL